MNLGTLLLQAVILIVRRFGFAFCLHKHAKIALSVEPESSA